MRRIEIGNIRGARVDVIAADAVEADAELAVACMFSHEFGLALRGGLLALDRTLGGALVRLRADGIFKAAAGDTMLLATTEEIRADNLLLVGLGDPETWTPATMTIAVEAAAKQAENLGSASIAIAPGLLDSGMAGAALEDVPAAMMRGLVRGLPTRATSLSRWSFCSSGSALEPHAEALRLALEGLAGA